VLAALILTILAGSDPSAARDVRTALAADGRVPEQAETIAEILVHGNHVSPDEEVLRLAGVTVGMPVTPTTIADIKKRLEDAHKFDDVTVSKRYGSITDLSKIVIVIVVNEGPVKIKVPDAPDAPLQVVKRGTFANLMFMPILNGEDGYAFTYGARVAYVGMVGERSRVSFPLTWGGTRKAGAEFERIFDKGPIGRIEIGTAIQQRRNPAFDLPDQRRRVWARVERSIGPLRTGATGGWQRVLFGSIDDHIKSFGVDAAFDTRLDPLLPRNAVFVTGSWERLRFDAGDRTNRTRVDARGYLGLIRQTILVGRVVREDANRPLPPYLKSLLGGWSSLRGFKAGSFVGDTMVNGSLELRVPLSSPLSVGKLGVSVFIDKGTAYDKGERYRDQTLRTGIGAGAWVTLAAFQLGVAVAHGRGADTRFTFAGGLTF